MSRCHPFTRLKRVSQSSIRGFTLLEMLAAMSIVCLVAALMLASLAFSTKVFTKQADLSHRTMEVQLAQRLLRELLQNIYPDPTTFSGSASEAKFVAHIERGGNRDGLYELRFHVVRELNEPVIVLDWQEVSVGKGDAVKNGRSVVYAGSIKDLEISYLKDLRPLAAPVWVTDWSFTDMLPAQMRVRVQPETNSGTVWPELVVTLLSDTPSTCAFDVVSRVCRTIHYEN